MGDVRGKVRSVSYPMVTVRATLEITWPNGRTVVIDPMYGSGITAEDAEQDAMDQADAYFPEASKLRVIDAKRI